MTIDVRYWLLKASPQVDEDDDSNADRITCNRCGTEGLHWQEIVTSEGYLKPRLFNERNRPHKCEPSTNGFDVLP